MKLIENLTINNTIIPLKSGINIFTGDYDFNNLNYLEIDTDKNYYAIEGMYRILAPLGQFQNKVCDIDFLINTIYSQVNYKNTSIFNIIHTIIECCKCVGASTIEECKQTECCLFLDSIDGNLPPYIQSDFLTILHSVFPNMQIIAITYSPIILSSIDAREENIVYLIDGDIKEIHPYGIDANSIYEEIFYITPRCKEVADKITKFKKLVSNKQFSEAETKLSELETITDPRQVDLVSLRALLSSERILNS